MFNIDMPLYGVFNIISLFLSIIFQIHMLNKKTNNFNDIIVFTLYELIGIVLGGKLFTYLSHYNVFDGNFDLIGLGMSSVGSLIGALLMLTLFSFQFKIKLFDIIYVFIITVPLLYGIGKIGCFFGGCCRGFLYNGIGAVIYKYGYNATGLSYFPIQIVESIVFIIIFIYILGRTKKNGFCLPTVGITLIVCGICKFFLDFFRLEHINKILSTNQVFCLIFILIGFYISRNKLFKSI